MKRGEVRLEDLPPKVRAQIEAQEQTQRKRASSGATGGGSWRCVSCGKTFTQYAPAQRHADDERHPRIECVLTRKGEDDENDAS